MTRRSRIIQRLPWACLIFFFLFPMLSIAQRGSISAFPLERDDLTLGRTAQPNTYFDKAGRRFAILGLESGTFEAWAYPLKLIRNFELSFLLRNSSRPIPAKELVRSIEVTPAATTLTYACQSFTVKATYVTAIDDPGAVVLLGIDSTEPLTIVAGFLPVLQPMWPAGIGGQFASWDDELKAYLISEPTRKNHGFVGSPAAQGISYTPAHMLSDSPNEFTIVIDDPAVVEGKYVPIVLAGGKGAREGIRKAYEKLAADPKAVYDSAVAHYRNLRQRTLRVHTPLPRLDLAFEWVKISYDNLRVNNPDLGNGLVAGLGLSGTGGRPGFGWFFGTDAYLNSLSLLSCGDFEAAKEALTFTQKWQRPDGKMAHELSQAAGYIDWFRDFPYGYIHGDTTPFYIAAMDEYLRMSGDLDFIRRSWPSLKRAFDWCLTTDGDGDGLMDNSKAGLGALEFGSLTGIQTDIYLAAVWIRAAQAMQRLARAMDEKKLAADAGAAQKAALASFEAKFWDEEKGQYSYAFNADGERVKELTPWCAVPLLWGIGRAERAAWTMEKMNSADLATSWGTRILTRRSPLYEPLNYNYGAVWPFLTGYVAAAHFEHGLALQGYGLVLANARHLFDNALGCATELFSGGLNIWPQEAVAHQGFSAGGFLFPFVRGLLGLGGDAAGKKLVFKPALPADWPEVKIEKFRLGDETFDLRFKRDDTRVVIEVLSRPGNAFECQFTPAFGPGTRIRRALVNGQLMELPSPPDDQAFRQAEQIVFPPFRLTGREIVDIELEPMVEIIPPGNEFPVGDFDKGLKIINLDVSGKNLKAVVEGLAGESYTLRITHGELVQDVVGASLLGSSVTIKFPAGKERDFVRREVVLNLK
jgi:Mannosylglycerate hydrolase MGH1-like glycoside hydrolase domain